MSVTNPLPVYEPDSTATATISATDAVLGAASAVGALLTGTPTASSYVALALTGGDSTFVLQLTGTFGGGTVWFECSGSSSNGIDGSWASLPCRQEGITGSGATILAGSATVASLWRGVASGMSYVRARITGATAPSVAVSARASSGEGPVALGSALPVGTNTIGTVGPVPATTGTGSSPALSATSFTVLAANTARRTATFYNDSVNVLYLGLFGTSSVTAYTVQVPAGGYYELPGIGTVYTGIVTGISLVASGNVRVTELT